MSGNSLCSARVRLATHSWPKKPSASLDVRLPSGFMAMWLTHHSCRGRVVT